MIEVNEAFEISLMDNKNFVLHVIGEVNNDNVRGLDNYLHKFLEDGGKNVVLDFGNIKYIGSTGVGLLFRLAELFKTKGGSVKIVHAGKRLVELLKMLGFLSFFICCDTLEEAVVK